MSPEPAIDWVSPLPPVPSGISDYSADLLPFLAERTDLRLLTLPGQPVDDALLERYPHRPLASTPASESRLRVYQMGNNPYHQQVYEAALQAPGVMTLHDFVLHHFHLGRTLLADRPQDYAAQLRADHGEIGEIAGRLRLRGIHSDAAMFELPMNRSLVRSQRGVIVHSEWTARRLREEDPELSIEIVPMAMPLPELPSDEKVRHFRAQLGLDKAAVVLGSFGFQTRIKRTRKAIEALASPKLAGAHLLIAGKDESESDIEREARRLGVRDRVHSVGYLPFEELVAAIRACDLCLCLRYPTAGETSAALMRVLAAGRPALVTDYGQFAELPDDVAIKVPLGEGEVAALIEAGERYARDPSLAEVKGSEARAWIARHHDPGRVADRLVEAIEGLSKGLPLGEAGAEPFLPTTVTWGLLSGQIVVRGAERPWKEGERRRLEIELRNTGVCRWLAAERGPGGVMLAYQLMTGERNLVENESWLALPRDLDPGQSCVIELDIRRPPGEAELILEPHVEGGSGFGVLGGPTWRQTL